MRQSLFSVTLLALLLLPGCGEEAVPKRDPTLRGLVSRLQEQGLTVGAPMKLDMASDQRARVGKAAGIANEVVGAGLRSDFPTETQRRTIEGVTVQLERYASAEKARKVHASKAAAEGRQRDPGKFVHLLAGDKLLTVHGSGAAPGSHNLPRGLKVRPANPPPADLVDRLEAALEAAEL